MGKVNEYLKKVVMPSKIKMGIRIGMIGSLVASVIAAIYFRLVLLNEEQLLYLFFAMAQVIAGLFGLTLTAYTFFADKFQQQADDSEYEAVTSLVNQYYGMIISISLICGVTILTCVLGIIFLSHSSVCWYAFIIDVSVCWFCVACVSILFFGISILDPEKIKKELSEKVLKFESQDDNEAGKNNGQDSNANRDIEFLQHYISLEKTIIDFAEKILKSQTFQPLQGNHYKQYKKPRVLQAMDILVRSEKISANKYEEINNLRQIRNALVHQMDVHVSTKQYECIVSLYNELHALYASYKNCEESDKYSV